MEQMLIFVVCMILLSIVFVPSAAEVIDQLVQEQRCAGRCFGDAYQAALHMARMQQPLGIGEDAVQMTILRPVHSLIRRSEEHTSELQSLMRISYAVFCLKKKKTHEKYHLQ